MKATKVLIISISISLFISCTACSLPFGNESDNEDVRIVTWNVQNLFDDIENGTEYDEFIPGDGGWDSDLFHLRMSRIKEVFSALFDAPPHIILLQEIENLNTLDILNSKYLDNFSYDWAVMIEEEGASVGTAVLSSIPIKSVSSIQTGYWGNYRLRALTEILFDLNGDELVIINNHWKSKSGGSAATEQGRISCAEALSGRIKKLLLANKDLMIIAAGDFNENHDEYKLIERSYRTALIPIFEDVPPEWDKSLFVTSKKEKCGIIENRTTMYSPWYDTGAKGSYAYKSVWRKIDHFFLSGSLLDEEGYEYESFRVISDSFLMNDYNYPARWDHMTEEGYSDHLPLELIISNKDE
ncbi:MAG: endonuclease/exonuclease/phosphatase family protein [Deltaproteobacteria bacterium]|nr:endonuclease/exonuclease/phosphatase family protein [Deltaproteobacteria bacterium]